MDYLSNVMSESTTTLSSTLNGNEKIDSNNNSNNNNKIITGTPTTKSVVVAPATTKTFATTAIAAGTPVATTIATATDKGVTTTALAATTNVDVDGINMNNLSIKEISEETGIKVEDIISTLQFLDMIRCWKGQHVVYVQQNLIQEYMNKARNSKNKIRLCKPEHLDWKSPLSTSSTSTTAAAAAAAVLGIKLK